MMKYKDISERLKKHYNNSFEKYGPTSAGVDWGEDQYKCFLRYDKMLNVIKDKKKKNLTLLDVGCGFGGLLLYAREKGYNIDYVGIDVSDKMINWANNNIKNAEFLNIDIIDYDGSNKFDYIVCNGILTQKLETSIISMDEFCKFLIKKFYKMCKIGFAFNVMTNKVNFMVDNLFYKSPVEMMAYCLTEVSSKIIIDHSYPLYEYTTYIYKD